MEKPKIKPIYIHVPEKEYKVFKIFALNNGLSLQRLIRSAVHFYIREAQKND
jgi:predicted DNA binding CopG/RHH family protein